MSIFSLFIFSCDEDSNPVVPENIYGCTEPSSCSYDPNVNIYVPDSCLELDECGECGGDNSTCTDDCGIINGNNESKDCGGSCNQENVELWGECYNIEETTILELNSSGLTGEIPSEVGNLINLTTINLQWNELSGEIPSEIGNLTNLDGLYLSQNQLTGEIPVEIYNLINLRFLYLHDNQLSGEIPQEIGNLTNLLFLGIWSNEFSGEIPNEIGNLINVYQISLNDNQLSGIIPQTICNSGDFQPGPGLTGNYFCPPYPDCGEGPITSEEEQDTSNCP